MQVKFKKLHNDAKIPQYMTKGAAGFDLSTIEDIDIPPQWVCMVETGLSVAIETGFELQIRSRSGLASKNQITVLNSPGTVDSDYRGPIKVILYNHSGQTFSAKKGDRIAQGVISPVVQATILEVLELDATERGDGGFGHTGK